MGEDGADEKRAPVNGDDDDDGDDKVKEKGDDVDEDDEGDASPSFYVADDEKSIAIVDLLLESKDKT